MLKMGCNKYNEKNLILIFLIKINYQNCPNNKTIEKKAIKNRILIQFFTAPKIKKFSQSQFIKQF